MTTRSLSLLAAVLLTGTATPALAQERYDPGEPPPLPELSQRGWHDEDAAQPEADPGEPGERDAYDPPPPGPAGPDPRAAWLDRCRARTGSAWDEGRGSCEAYLHDYERFYAAPAERGRRYGYLPGYPGPVLWVRVPVEGGCCECRETAG